MERIVTERLDVYLCDRLAGALERTDGRISFRYLAEYLESDSPAVVSSTLPLSERIYEERDVMAFFSNLLRHTRTDPSADTIRV